MIGNSVAIMNKGRMRNDANSGIIDMSIPATVTIKGTVWFEAIVPDCDSVFVVDGLEMATVRL